MLLDVKPRRRSNRPRGLTPKPKPATSRLHVKGEARRTTPREMASWPGPRSTVVGASRLVQRLLRTSVVYIGFSLHETRCARSTARSLFMYVSKGTRVLGAATWRGEGERATTGNGVR